MGRWSPTTTPQSRMVWFKCRWVPLECWCEEFFLKIVWIIGEPLLLEEETSMRKRVDREEEVTPVDFRWLENFLGLRAFEPSLSSFLDLAIAEVAPGSKKGIDGLAKLDLMKEKPIVDEEMLVSEVA
ncbi:hypothetical protein Q3G72_032127 [Acer saccharum]|nr:hypothetical protein Q3G72_032127 [Acer saccharum]